MKLSEIKKILETVDQLTFILPNGTAVPAHFHITEVGQVTKHFIDCGGTLRIAQSIHFQLWSSIDIYHRLSSEKLCSIIALSEEKLNLPDWEVEVEYQGETIEIYGLRLEDGKFHLTPLSTDCLAKDKCNIPIVNEVVQAVKSCCDPKSGCC